MLERDDDGWGSGAGFNLTGIGKTIRIETSSANLVWIGYDGVGTHLNAEQTKELIAALKYKLQESGFRTDDI